MQLTLVVIGHDIQSKAGQVFEVFEYRQSCRGEESVSCKQKV